MTSDLQEKLIGLKSAADNLGISRRTLDRIIAAGELPSLKIGRRRLVRQEALLTWLSSKEAIAA